MKEIQLTQGYVTQVDDVEFERCMEGPQWHAEIDHHKDGTINNVYAVRSVRKEDGTRTTQRLHRFILGVTDPKVEVDHDDHDGLNNQRYNLRSATHTHNQHNQRLHSTNTSGYKGVSWDKEKQKWRAHIGVDGKRKYLGRFYSPEDAKQAYDAAALKYHGEFACTNEMLEAA